MYRILLIMAAALLPMFSGEAALAGEVAGYPVGYCNGEYGTRSNYKSDEAPSEISAAVYIPSSVAATVAGNILKTVKVAICSARNVRDFNVWIRSSLDGQNLTGAAVENGAVVQGWNYVQLDAALPIDNVKDGFYIGYSYTQPAKSGAVSTLPSPHADAFWLRFGTDGEWTDLSDEATLCIEGLVFGENIPKINASVIEVRPDPWFILSEGKVGASVSVRNLGVETISSLGIEMDFGQGCVCASDIDCDIPYGQVGSYRVDFTPDTDKITMGQTYAVLKVVSVNGQADADMKDNVADVSFKVIDKAYRRKCLIEEFTAESCPNCPRVAEYLHEIREDPAYSDKIEIMAHHSGYATDFLTTEADKAYAWFYNDPCKFAPAVMIDRQLTSFSETTPLFVPQSKEMICGQIDDHFNEPCFVSVGITGRYDDADENLVHVTVSGNRLDDELLADKGRITLCVLEDNIDARNQAGSGVGYKHHFVLRSVNAVWGEEIPWSGNDFSYNFDFRLNPEWVKNNLRMIAYVADYDESNPLNCQVYNADGFDLDGSNASVADGTFAEKRIVRIFNSAGLECKAMTNGLYFVVYDDNTVAKIIK